MVIRDQPLICYDVGTEQDRTKGGDERRREVSRLSICIISNYRLLSTLNCFPPIHLLPLFRTSFSLYAQNSPLEEIFDKQKHQKEEKNGSKVALCVFSLEAWIQYNLISEYRGSIVSDSLFSLSIWLPKGGKNTRPVSFCFPPFSHTFGTEEQR